MSALVPRAASPPLPSTVPSKCCARCSTDRRNSSLIKEISEEQEAAEAQNAATGLEKNVPKIANLNENISKVS